MRVILKDDDTQIGIDAVKQHHIVVSLCCNKHPWILSSMGYGYKFIRLYNPAEGNNFIGSPAPTMAAAIRRALENCKIVEVFEDWRLAFNWLLEHTNNDRSFTTTQERG